MLAHPHVGPSASGSSRTLVSMTGEIEADISVDRGVRGVHASMTLVDAVRSTVSGLLGREIVRFGLVGVVNTGLDLGVYFALQVGGTPVLLANFVSTSVGLAFSFVANRLFTFSARPSGGAVRQLALFVLCTGIGLWAVQPLVLLGMDRLLRPLAGLGAWHILISKCVAIGFGFVWNWTLYNKVVFSTRRS